MDNFPTPLSKCVNEMHVFISFFFFISLVKKRDLFIHFHSIFIPGLVSSQYNYVISNWCNNISSFFSSSHNFSSNLIFIHEIVFAAWMKEGFYKIQSFHFHSVTLYYKPNTSYCPSVSSNSYTTRGKWST